MHIFVYRFHKQLLRYCREALTPKKSLNPSGYFFISWCLIFYINFGGFNWNEKAKLIQIFDFGIFYLLPFPHFLSIQKLWPCHNVDHHQPWLKILDFDASSKKECYVYDIVGYGCCLVHLIETNGWLDFISII